jgi:hypothetical protein
MDAEFARCTPATLFETSFWLDLVAPGCWRVAEVRTGGELFARLPYVLGKNRFGRLAVEMPPLTPFLGPSMSSPGEKYVTRLSRNHDLLQKLIDQIPSVDSFHQRLHPSLTNWLPFHWSGYQQTTRYTYRVRHSPSHGETELWDQVDRSVRTDVRKAMNALTVVFEDDIDVFVQLHHQVFSRQGLRAPHSAELLRTVDSACSARQCRTIAVARDRDGRAHAAAFFVWDAGTVYYLLGGSDPELRSSGATTLLLWNGLLLAGRMARDFDFEGSMSQRLERLFRAFGAEQTPYFEINKQNSRLVRIVRDVRSWWH